MYQNVYFQGVQRRPVIQQQNNVYADNPFKRTDYKQFNEISPAVNSAIYAYASPIIRKPYEKMSLYECISALKKQGYVEGLNYETDRNRLVQIKNKYGNVVKCLGYDNPNDTNPFVQNLSYDSNNRLVKLTCIEDNRVKFYEDTYYNDEVPQEQFTDARITYRTSPNEYLNYLKSKNANYKVEKESGEDFNIVRIIEYGDKDDKKSRIAFIKYNDGYNQVNLDEYGSQEELVKEISFTPTTTRVQTYLEKIQTSFIPKEMVQQEILTKEHINAYTKPEDYVQYLEQNGIKYKIDTQEFDGQKRVGITEYDMSNRKTKVTGFELNAEPCVMHEIYNRNGNRTRYEFGLDGTSIAKHSY